MTYLPSGLPHPVPERDGLSTPYWQGLAAGKLMVQTCTACNQSQWGPEWICHRCHSFTLTWREVMPSGTIYSWERVWHPSHPALANACPYLVALIAIDGCDGVRLIGNLLGNPLQDVVIGAAVEGVFEHHPSAGPPFSLLQWRRVLPMTAGVPEHGQN